MANYIKDIRKMIGNSPLRVCGGSVIVYHENKILLQLRDDSKLWCYPGGCIELGEYIEDGAKRELFEETELIANKLELFKVFSGPEFHYTYPNGDYVDIIDIVYICTDFNGEIPMSTEESLELKWFDINNMPSIDEIHPPARSVIKEVIEYLKRK